MRKGLFVTAIVVIVCGAFVWFVSTRNNPERQFLTAYNGYRAVPRPDAGKLDEWDRQLKEAYQTMKDAITAGDKTAAKNHLTPFTEITGAQADFFKAQATAHKKEAGLLPDLNTKASALKGEKKTLATRLVNEEADLLKLGEELNNGSLTELNLWHELGNNFTSFLNGEIDGTKFLSEETQIGQRIETARKGQAAPGAAAQEIIKKINADWNALKSSP